MRGVEVRDVRAGPVALGRVWLAAGVGLAALAGLLLVVLADQGADAQSNADEAGVNWSPCHEHFECAVVPVPLDHQGEEGGTIQLSLIRLPAADGEAREGSLFVNPGGPGGSGVSLVRRAGHFFPDQIREQYDLVGFDPRGVGRSSPLRCFGTTEQAFQAAASRLFPMTEEEQQQRKDSDEEVADACDQRAGRIIDHMTTADVARDMDLLRQALGDDKLNYLGFSYGSYLGTTYANLFPERVGRMVIDGVLDPIAWATGREATEDLPFSTRLDSHVGAQDTLEEFFRLCDAAAADPDSAHDCRFGPNAEARFAALADALRDEPLKLPAPDGHTVEFTYQRLIGSALGSMYGPGSWPFFADFLVALEEAVEARDDATLEKAGERYSDLPWSNPRGTPAYPNFVEAFPGVACSDSDNPDRFGAWPQAAAAADAEADSYFGRPWTWVSSLCAVWPGEGDGRYTGPWDADPAEPVLVVGNRFDPATPHHGAEIVHGQLANSQLLTYQGWGHVAMGRSPCVDKTIIDYLLDEHDDTETTCPAAPSPFDVPPFTPQDDEGDGDTRFPDMVQASAAAERADGSHSDER